MFTSLLHLLLAAWLGPKQSPARMSMPIIPSEWFSISPSFHCVFMIQYRKTSRSFRLQGRDRNLAENFAVLGLSPKRHRLALRVRFDFFSVLPNQIAPRAQHVAEHGRLPLCPLCLRNASQQSNQSIQITVTPYNHKQRWTSSLLPSPPRAMPLRLIRTPPWPRSPERPRRPGRPTTPERKLRR